jgi:hypothetical protein
VDYDIDIKVTRQVRGRDVSIWLVRATVEPPGCSFSDEFIAVDIWPKTRQIVTSGKYGRYDHPAWPADWPGRSYTQIEYEADLVSLATRLAVQEWQRQQEGGR